MILYRKFIYFILVFITYSNKLNISGPSLVRGGTWNWLTSCCGGSGCCGSSCCNSNCCNSCGSSSAGSSDKSEKTAVVNINARSGDGFISEEVGSKFTFKPQSGYYINAVKDGDTEIWKTEKKEDYSKKVTVEYFDGKLTIYIGSNESSKKVFKRVDGNKWTEDTNASTQSATDASGGTTGSGGGTGTGEKTGTGTGGSNGTAGDGTTGTAGANQSGDGGGTPESKSGTDTSGGSTQQATPDSQ